MSIMGRSEDINSKDHESLLRLAHGGGTTITDFDVLKKYFRFTWREGIDDKAEWGSRMAKRYVQKLFKEFALADLSRWKEGRVGLRWRIEREVIEGKGQFICGNLACSTRERLASYELNFKYMEAGETKNELVKVRLCGRCAQKLEKSKASSTNRQHRIREEEQEHYHKDRKKIKREKTENGEESDEKGRNHKELSQTDRDAERAKEIDDMIKSILEDDSEDLKK